MTASDHLKHRTGSLGGDQIPEKWREVYRQCEEFLAQPGEPSTKPVEWCIQILDDLAQKTRECEELKREAAESADDAASTHRLNQSLKAQVEQLGRQVAEMTAVLNEVKEEECSCDMGLEAYTPCASCKATQLLLASRARTK